MAGRSRSRLGATLHLPEQTALVERIQAHGLPLCLVALEAPLVLMVGISLLSWCCARGLLMAFVCCRAGLVLHVHAGGPEGLQCEVQRWC